MGHTTDASGIADVRQFYDELAADYDVMTAFEKRFVQERPFFRILVDTHGLTTAIDAGSGTGFHSILLAQLGVRVTAVDLSGQMLARLRDHAITLALPIDTLEIPFSELAASIRTPVDGLFSMGNTLAHLLTPGALATALENFARVIRPGGILFLQLLNYARILSARTRVQNVREEGGTTFIRYYDFAGETIRFNVMRVLRGGGKPEAQISSVELRPVLPEQLAGLLADAGFTEIRTFGSIAMEEYSAQESRDLVVLARRP